MAGSIWDTFEEPQNEAAGASDCVLRFAAEHQVIRLGEAGSPRTLADAFKLYARSLGTDPGAEVNFRGRDGALAASTVLVAGQEYTATVKADRHG